MKKVLLSFITLGILIGCEKSDSCDEARAIYSGNCNSTDTSKKEEALSYQKNWWELASQNKILRVPISNEDKN